MKWLSHIGELSVEPGGFGMITVGKSSWGSIKVKGIR